MDPAAYEASNGYIIEEQGKPPNFVLEIASPNTGRVDVGEKRATYERLAGDRLADGVYQPIVINELSDGALQGYSQVLNLSLRWENGGLAWHDPATGRHIATFESERGRADTESEARNRADVEREARVRAEERVRELEAENQRLRNG